MIWLIIVNFSLLCFLGQTSPSSTQSHSQACTSYGRQPGQCVIFQSCPPLQDILENAREDSFSLRRLQQLTFGCGFSGSTPNVCCPLNAIKNALQLSESESNSGSSYGKVGNSNTGPNSPNQTIQLFSSHPNFRFLPTFESCSSTSITDRVVGGKAAPHGSYSWLVRIGYKVFDTGHIVHGCSGSIISDRYVISAAHCFTDLGAELGPDGVRLGEYNTETNPDCSKHLGCTSVNDIKIEKIIVHPEYSAGSKQNDICLIRLREKLSFESDSTSVKPVCLPLTKEYGIQNFPESLEGRNGVVAGFGKTRWNKARGSVLLQHVELPIIANSKCQDSYKKFSRLTISASQICAGGVPGRDSCDGDSGGPLMITYHDKSSEKTTTIQVGIVSFGPRQCGGPSEVPSVYTKVTPYLKWILDSLED